MRKIAWIMSMLLLLPTLIVPGAAADSDAGMTFTADKKLALSKTLEKAPVTGAGTVVLKKKR